MITPGSNSAAAKQSQEIDTLSSVEAATPHRLIQLMMERALAKIGVELPEVEEKPKRKPRRKKKQEGLPMPRMGEGVDDE